MSRRQSDPRDDELHALLRQAITARFYAARRRCEAEPFELHARHRIESCRAHFFPVDPICHNSPASKGM